MKISIIILNYKTPGEVINCVQSVLAHPPIAKYEIILVDNSPQDTDGLFEKTFSFVRVIQTPKNGGFAYGVNRGIREAHGEYILILNPDITVRDGAITKLQTYLDSYDDVGIVAPRLYQENGLLQYSCLRFPDTKMPLIRRTPLRCTTAGRKYLDWYELRNWDHESEKDVDWVTGAALMVRAASIKDVGLFDENFFMYVEDIDWCRRFWEKKWRVVYLPVATMTHKHRRASAKRNVILGLLDYPTRLHVKSFIYYIKKYRGKSLPHIID